MSVVRAVHTERVAAAEDAAATAAAEGVVEIDVAEGAAGIADNGAAVADQG